MSKIPKRLVKPIDTIAGAREHGLWITKTSIHNNLNSLISLSYKTQQLIDDASGLSLTINVRNAINNQGKVLSLLLKIQEQLIELNKRNYMGDNNV